MSEILRVAHIVGKMCNGGVENTVLNYYKNIDKDNIQFDFFVDEDSTIDLNVLKKEINDMGGEVYVVPPYQQLNKYIFKLSEIFKKNNYKIVHSHLNTLNIFPLYAAKKANVPVRIAHNHSTAGKGEMKKNILKYMLRPFGKLFATNLVACTRYAGEWMWGKKTFSRGEIKVFYNAIDLEKFKKNGYVREKYRKELNINDKFVIGNVGRFCKQKNHEFLIDVFYNVYKKNDDAVLILVGEGSIEKDIKDKVNNLNLDKSVIFAGTRRDVYNIYQVMDVFVFPSIYEGLGMAAIEAQAIGLPTIVSTGVPKEAKITNKIKFLSIDDGVDVWADEILRVNKSNDLNNEHIIDEYDIRKQVKELEKYYKSFDF